MKNSIKNNLKELQKKRKNEQKEVERILNNIKFDDKSFEEVFGKFINIK